MTIFVVYKDPKDYPGKFVVRRWENETPTLECWVEDTYKKALEHIPNESVRIPRSTDDDPVIVETWV